MDVEAILAITLIFGTPFAVFAMIFGINYVKRTALNKERMALIEKGFSPEEIASALKEKVEQPKKKEKLSQGLLFVGVAFGLVVGYFFNSMTDVDSTMAYLSCAFLFGGVGMVISHYLLKREKDQEKDIFN